jgi:hypothetical protein
MKNTQFWKVTPCPVLPVPKLRSDPSAHKGVVPCLRSLVASLSTRRHQFNPRPVHVGFVVDKLITDQGFLLVYQRSSAINIPTLLHTHSFIYDRSYEYINYWLTVSLNTTHTHTHTHTHWRRWQHILIFSRIGGRRLFDFSSSTGYINQNSQYKKLTIQLGTTNDE